MNGRCIDLTGRKFGYYTVIKRVPPHIVAAEYPKNNGGAIWYCKCKCGDVNMVPSNNLLYGKSHGCMSCSAKGRHNGGNPWSEERRRKQVERRIEDIAER